MVAAVTSPMEVTEYLLVVEEVQLLQAEALLVGMEVQVAHTQVEPQQHQL
jgi:hypothetical protein